MRLIEKIEKTVLEHKLISEGESVLAALSGGADSVALTYALWLLKDKYKLKLFAAHINHNIRSEAKRDELFVKRFCEKLGIECFVKNADVPRISKEKGMSEELAGREVRYAFFDEVLKGKNIDKIATAHNKNDNAETILMHFFRGSSLNGLSGIPYMRGNIIRPVLDLSRAEIEEFCREYSLDYVTDNTNFERLYTRNKIRLDVLPFIEREFNQSFVNTVANNANIIREDNECLNSIAAAELGKCGEYLDTDRLKQLHVSIRRRVIMGFMRRVFDREHDIFSSYVNDIMALFENSSSGKEIALADGVFAWVEYNRLYIGKKENNTGFEYTLPLNEKIYIKELGISVFAKRARKRENDGALYFEAKENSKIKIRSRKEGDIFFPSGMNGRKKVKDYFINEKIPKSQRDKIGIITIDNEIACIIGKRYDRRFKFKTEGIKILTEEGN